MDATFLESDTFFPPPLSTSPLEGQVQNEEQNCINFEWLVFGENSEQVDNEIIVGEKPNGNEVNMSPRTESIESISFESSCVTPLVTTDPSLENSLEINSLTTHSLVTNLDASAGYVLPFRNNRGKPPNRYSPDIEGKKNQRYSTANYVSI